MWNEHITSPLLDGAKSQLASLGVANSNIIELFVPGAFELPFGSQILFEKHLELDAVICLGCVIKGETPHFDYVCLGATQGIMNVGLKYNKPCIYGLITVNTLEQAKDRIGGNQGHKGIESAQTAIIQIINNL